MLEKQCPKVLIGTPNHGYISFAPDGITTACLKPSNGKVRCAYKRISGSLLTHNFNKLWATALSAYDNGLIDYFVMLHDDILPCDFFVDILLEELLKNKADVVSCVVPIKDCSGETSTAIENPNDEWKVERRITLKECGKLPITFDIKDLGYNDNRALLINTGLWIADLSKSWCRQEDEFGNLKVYFKQNDRIYKNKDDIWSCDTMSEDWNFGKMLRDSGAKVMATTSVYVQHFGFTVFDSEIRRGNDAN